MYLKSVANATNERDDSAFEIFSKYQNFDNVFFEKQTNVLTFHQNVNHVIKLKKNKLSYELLYNLSVKKLKTLRQYIDFALKKKWIRHFINSINYRDRNKMTKKNRYFLSLIIQILNQLNDSLYFIKIDFKNVYHRIRIRCDDEWKTAFRTRYDHFEYLIMSFDFVNASVIFQTYVNKTLIEIINFFCIVYLNDILIFSKNRKKHVFYVRNVLQRLRKFELYANLKKCNFFIKKIKHLNFIVNIDDITMNSRRIKIIRNWSMLKFFQNIQIFLKFVNFYWRFIHRYSQIIIFLINFFKNMQTDVKKKFS